MAIRTLWGTVPGSNPWTWSLNCTASWPKASSFLEAAGEAKSQSSSAGICRVNPKLSQVFLAGLPSILKVNVRDGGAGQWLENSIRFSVHEADASRAGGEVV